MIVREIFLINWRLLFTMLYIGTLKFWYQIWILPFVNLAIACTTIKNLYRPLSISEEEYGEKCVNVLLDGEEDELVFIDHPSTEISVSNIIH